MIEAIRRQVADYDRPLEGPFGEALRGAVAGALSGFVAMAREPGLGRASGREAYVRLGRFEAREGRSLEALLAAYRVGARVAWRRLAKLGLEAGLATETLVLLAESIFAYIDELSAESAEGFSQEQAERAGELERRRALLIALLVRSPPADPSALKEAAERAQWSLPTQLAIAVWSEDVGRRPARALPAGTIVGRLERSWCAAVPDSDGPGRRERIRAALSGHPAGVGVAVAPEGAARSHRLAGQALAMALEDGVGAPVFADEQRLPIVMRAERSLLGELAEERLRALRDETPASRARLEATLLAWLRSDGDVGAAAAELVVHPQTVRYRLGRLRDLLGGELDDPDRRFELELVLRARSGTPSER